MSLNEQGRDITIYLEDAAHPHGSIQAPDSPQGAIFQYPPTPQQAPRSCQMPVFNPAAPDGEAEDGGVAVVGI